MYDVHGTIEEARQFTEAIGKWDISSIDQLPEYMRHCYQPLLDVFDEAKAEIANTGEPSDGIGYALNAYKRVVIPPRS